MWQPMPELTRLTLRSSINMLKSKGDRTPPWCTPLQTVKDSDITLYNKSLGSIPEH